MLWVDMIQWRLGGISMGRIEKWLSEENRSDGEFWDKCSKRFHQYRQGKKTPGDDYRDHVESKLIGSKQIFDHPLWWILDNPQAEKDDIHDHMRMLCPPVYNRLFRCAKKHGPSARRTLRNFNQIRNIGAENNLDALAGLLMLLQEIELNQQYDYYGHCHYEIRDLLSRLAIMSPYHRIAERLGQLITERFKLHNELIEAFQTTGDNTHSIGALIPENEWDIQREAFENVIVLNMAKRIGLVSDQLTDQLEYLFQWQLESPKRYQPPNPQLELFPLHLCSYTSEPFRSKQHKRTNSNSEPVQVRQYTHMRALDGFAHCAGHM